MNTKIEEMLLNYEKARETKDSELAKGYTRKAILIEIWLKEVVGIEDNYLRDLLKEKGVVNG